MTRARSIPTGVSAPGRAQIAARTLRTDRWWQAPLITVVAALGLGHLRDASHRQPAGVLRREGPLPLAVHLAVRHGLLSAAARDFGTWFGHFPPFIPLAILVLPFLLGFRLTCYYYRRAYYRSFWQSPPACAVAEPHGRYTGETRFPLIVQNLHRYFFYAATADLADQHLGPDPRVPRARRRLRLRPRHAGHGW